MAKDTRTEAEKYEDAIRRQDAVELREKRRERMAEILPAILERLDKKYAADGEPEGAA